MGDRVFWRDVERLVRPRLADGGSVAAAPGGHRRDGGSSEAGCVGGVCGRSGDGVGLGAAVGP